MKLPFSKFEGAGNDFVAIDNMSSSFNLTTSNLQRLCNRKTGIGADGVVVLQTSHQPECAFKLVYYNADGKEGSLCGNGSRCSLAFAEKIGLIDFKRGDHVILFEAFDGSHYGGKLSTSVYFMGLAEVKTAHVTQVDENNYFTDTGSPHHVRFVKNLSQLDVVNTGRDIRWNLYGQYGANINFVEKRPGAYGQLSVRTFERGVEDETLACGTGAVASALAAYLRHQNREKSEACDEDASPVTTQVLMPGGTLQVDFTLRGVVFSAIRLSGPARHVFDGTIVIDN